jgi:hypothetical protein
MRMRRLHSVSRTPDPSKYCANIQLGVLVLAVGGKVLADGNGLLDEHVEVLGDLGGEAY